VKKHGRFGEFIGCSGYPKCKYTRPITMGIKCPKCNEGEFVRRGSAGKGGRGRPRVFYGCSRYPDCDFTSPHMPIAEPCPKCGAPFIVEKRTKIAPFTPVSRKVATGKNWPLKHRRKRPPRKFPCPWQPSPDPPAFIDNTPVDSEFSVFGVPILYLRVSPRRSSVE